MNSKNRKRFILAGMSVMLIVMGAGFAKSQNRIKAARQGLGLSQMIEIQQFIGGLNLTDIQKTQIKDIIAQNKTPILQAARDVAKAQLDLMKGVQGAATALGAAQLQAANLRTQIIGQISPVLTPDQLEKVQQKKQLREERLQKLLDRLNSKIGG